MGPRISPEFNKALSGSWPHAATEEQSTAAQVDRGYTFALRRSALDFGLLTCSTLDFGLLRRSTLEFCLLRRSNLEFCLLTKVAAHQRWAALFEGVPPR